MDANDAIGPVCLSIVAEPEGEEEALPQGGWARRSREQSRSGSRDVGLVEGTQIGRYEIVRRLAAGGMAEVYLARALPGARAVGLVAIKRILPAFAQDASYLSMFLDEARISSRLDHPGIVRVHEIAVDEGEPFIAMEYLRGADLRTLLHVLAAAHQPLPLAFALHVAEEMCAALHHAHERSDDDGAPLGVVHRDVSPQNVYLTDDGKVKLLDFGLAHARKRSTDTQTGVIKGKLSYMSPEQCTGRVLDRRSDLFSLGILLYEMTVGHRPFDADTDYHVLRHIVDDDAVAPRDVVPDYPPALERVVLRVLRKDPAERPQTAEELGRELAACRAELGLATSRDALAQFVRATLDGDAAHMLAAGTAKTATRDSVLTVPSRPGMLLRRSRRPLGWAAALVAGVAAAIVGGRLLLARAQVPPEPAIIQLSVAQPAPPPTETPLFQLDAPRLSPLPLAPRGLTLESPPASRVSEVRPRARHLPPAPPVEKAPEIAAEANPPTDGAPGEPSPM